MTVDELLANPGINLPDGAIPIHAIILIEYVDPSDDTTPRTLSRVADDDLMSWHSSGILLAALDLERHESMCGFVEDEPDDEDGDS